MSGLFGGGGADDLPKVEAQNPSRRADPEKKEKDNRQKSMAASYLTKYWDDPELSQKGLLGK